MTVHQELGVGHDRCQRVTQVVRDGTGHAPDGGELFGFQQVLLTLQQAGAHAVKGARQFGDFVTSSRVQGVVEVSGAQRPHAAHQISQRPSEGMRDKEDQPAADHDCGQAQKKHVAIQLIQEFCGLIVGSHAP